MGVWYANEERRVIKKHKGKPLRKYGTDGLIGGKPVEVRSVRRDKRYRIQQNIHRQLVAKDGFYIFVKNGKTKKIRAKRVKLGEGKWFKDRKYPHKFLKVERIFKR